MGRKTAQAEKEFGEEITSDLQFDNPALFEAGDGRPSFDDESGDRLTPTAGGGTVFDTELVENSDAFPASDEESAGTPSPRSAFENDGGGSAYKASATSASASANRFGLRKIKDKYLSTDRNGVSMWSFKYTVNGEDFMANTHSFGGSVDNKWRQMVFGFVSHSLFELGILMTIILQTVIAMMSLPGDLQTYPWLMVWGGTLENIFLAVYSVEAFLRIFALGLFPQDHTYLRNRWNRIDFSLLVVSHVYKLLMYFGAPMANPALLRVIRCLRPLRAAGFLQGVKSALHYAPFLLNILLLLGVWITLFAVLGMQLYGGAMTFSCASDYDASNYELGSWSWNDEHLWQNRTVSCPTMVTCSAKGFSDSDELCLYHKDSVEWGFDNITQVSETQQELL
jgi:hypothetical protein